MFGYGVVEQVRNDDGYLRGFFIKVYIPYLVAILVYTIIRACFGIDCTIADMLLSLIRCKVIDIFCESYLPYLHDISHFVVEKNREYFCELYLFEGLFAKCAIEKTIAILRIRQRKTDENFMLI